MLALKASGKLKDAGAISWDEIVAFINNHERSEHRLAANEGSDDIQGCPNFWYAGIGSRDRIGCSTGFANLGWPSWQAQSRSNHTGGVNACFADGSVRFIGNGIDQGVWFHLLSANDGNPVCYVGD